MFITLLSDGSAGRSHRQLVVTQGNQLAVLCHPERTVISGRGSPIRIRGIHAGQQIQVAAEQICATPFLRVCRQPVHRADIQAVRSAPS